MQHDQMIFHDALLNFTRNLQHISRFRISPMRFVSYRPKKKTYYEVLGIESNASYEEVKEAFVALAKLLHPDGQTTSTSEASTAEINQTEKFMLVREAYEVLKNPEKRRAYDQGAKISQPKSNKSMEVIMKSDLSSSPARDDQVIDVQRLKTERYGLGNGKFYDIDLEDEKEDEMKKLWRRVITIFLLSMIGNYLFVELGLVVAYPGEELPSGAIFFGNFPPEYTIEVL